jgi:hypothetical protein
MLSLPSTRPSGSMGRRSSAFVGEDPGAATVLPHLWISVSRAATSGYKPDAGTTYAVAGPLRRAGTNAETFLGVLSAYAFVVLKIPSRQFRLVVSAIGQDACPPRVARQVGNVLFRYLPAFAPACRSCARRAPAKHGHGQDNDDHCLVTLLRRPVRRSRPSRMVAGARRRRRRTPTAWRDHGRQGRPGHIAANGGVIMRHEARRRRQ